MADQETKVTSNEEEVLEVQNDETSEEAEEALSSEIIEVEWDKVKTIFQGKAYANELHNRLGVMCASFEKSKYGMLKQITDVDAFLYSEGAALRDSLNIDKDLTYELKLPESEGDKAFFIRKDQ